MEQIYSDKQLQLLNDWRANKLKRINLLEGSVRSGKTWISLVLWAFWVATMPRNGVYIMVAKTLTSLQRNILDVLEKLVGVSNFTYSIGQKQGILFGRKVYLEGVNDARSESKIRGMTLQGAYCDELTLFTEDFFKMLLSRLSEQNAKLFATTNPDSPNHWVKTDFIDRMDELDMYAMQILIDDNPFLPPEYIENIKTEYSGVFYDRFILGLWVVAEGLVYPNFDPQKHIVKADKKPNDKYMYYISIDYGTSNPFSMGLWRVDPNTGKSIRIKEYYYESRKTHIQKDDNEYYQDLVKFADGYNIQSVVIDPSAASMITTIRNRSVFHVRKANNDVLDGIRYTAAAINKGMLMIDEGCEASKREFRSYSWDEKATEDKVIKENDHAMDDIRYFVNTILLRYFRHMLTGDYYDG